MVLAQGAEFARWCCERWSPPEFSHTFESSLRGAPGADSRVFALAAVAVRLLVMMRAVDAPNHPKHSHFCRRAFAFVGQ